MVTLEVKDNLLEITTEDNTVYLVKDYFTRNRAEEKQLPIATLCNIVHNILTQGNIEHIVVVGDQRYLYAQAGEGILTLEDCYEELILSADTISDEDFEKYSVSLLVVGD